MGDSLRYALCSQTVTLYHPDPEGPLPALWWKTLSWTGG